MDIKECLATYKDAMGMLTEVEKTRPCRTMARGKRDPNLDSWKRGMDTVRTNAQQSLTAYVVALLRGHAQYQGELELFVMNTQLTDCIDPDAVRGLVSQVRRLDESHDIAWLEIAVTHAMGDPRFRAQFDMIGGYIDLCVVSADSPRRSLDERLSSTRV